MEPFEPPEAGHMHTIFDFGTDNLAWLDTSSIIYGMVVIPRELPSQLEESIFIFPEPYQNCYCLYCPLIFDWVFVRIYFLRNTCVLLQ